MLRSHLCPVAVTLDSADSRITDNNKPRPYFVLDSVLINVSMQLVDTVTVLLLQKINLRQEKDELDHSFAQVTQLIKAESGLK